MFRIAFSTRSHGWRFQMVRIGNRLTAIVHGKFRRRFAFRAADAWVSRLATFGFEIEQLTHGRSGPFANFVVYARVGSARLVSRSSPADQFGN